MKNLSRRLVILGVLTTTRLSGVTSPYKNDLFVNSPNHSSSSYTLQSLKFHYECSVVLVDFYSLVFDVLQK